MLNIEFKSLHRVETSLISLVLLSVAEAQVLSLYGNMFNSCTKGMPMEVLKPTIRLAILFPLAANQICFKPSAVGD